MARVITWILVKISKILQWIIRSQVLSLVKDMDAVHRLNDDGRATLKL